MLEFIHIVTTFYCICAPLAISTLFDQVDHLSLSRVSNQEADSLSQLSLSLALCTGSFLFILKSIQHLMIFGAQYGNPMLHVLEPLQRLSEYVQDEVSAVLSTAKSQDEHIKALREAASRISITPGVLATYQKKDLPCRTAIALVMDHLVVLAHCYRRLPPSKRRKIYIPLLVDLSSGGALVLLADILNKARANCARGQSLGSNHPSAGTDKQQGLLSSIEDIFAVDEDGPSREKTLKILLKVVTNITKEPNIAKFRRLKRSGNGFKCLEAFPAAMNILVQLGFTNELEEDYLSIKPGDFDLSLLEFCDVCLTYFIHKAKRAKERRHDRVLLNCLSLLRINLETIQDVGLDPELLNVQESIHPLHQVFLTVMDVLEGFPNCEVSPSILQAPSTEDTEALEKQMISDIIVVGSALLPSALQHRLLSSLVRRGSELVFRQCIYRTISINPSLMDFLSCSGRSPSFMSMWEWLTPHAHGGARMKLRNKKVCALLTDMIWEENERARRWYEEDVDVKALLAGMQNNQSTKNNPTFSSIPSLSPKTDKPTYQRARRASIPSKSPEFLDCSLHLDFISSLLNAALRENVAGYQSPMVERVPSSSVGLLLCLQNNLFSRLLCPLYESDRTNVPFIFKRYSHLLLQSCINFLEAARCLKSPEQVGHDIRGHVRYWRASIVGTLLPTFLAGLSTVSCLEVPINPSILDSLETLHALCDEFEGLDDLPLQDYVPASQMGSEGVCVEPYEDLLDILDPTGNPITAFFCRIDTNSSSCAVQNSIASALQLDPEGDQDTLELANEIRKSPGNVCVLGSLESDSERRLIDIIDKNVFGVEGREKDLRLQRSRLEHSAMFTCSMCGRAFPEVGRLVSHMMGTSPKSDGEKSLCDDHNAWFCFLRHLLVWSVSKLSRKLASDGSDTGAAGTSKQKMQPSSQSHSKTLPGLPEQWLESELFLGGYEDTFIPVSKIEEGHRLPTEFTPTTVTKENQRHQEKTYEGQLFLEELISGQGIAEELDKAVLDSPALRVYGTHRRIAGEDVQRAVRAIVAVLIKHTDKLDQAMNVGAEIANSSSASERQKLVRGNKDLTAIWKKANSIIKELISKRQAGLRLLCAVPGCLKTTIEDNGSYFCQNQHSSTKCISRETITYIDMAKRINANCAFLLQLRSASHTSKEMSLVRVNSSGVRNLLRRKSIDIYEDLKGSSPEKGYESPQKELHESVLASRSEIKPEAISKDLSMEPSTQGGLSIETLCLAFAMKVDEDSNHLLHDLSDMIEFSVNRALQRARAVDLLCLLLRKAPSSIQLFILKDLHAVVRAWVDPTLTGCLSGNDSEQTLGKNIEDGSHFHARTPSGTRNQRKLLVTLPDLSHVPPRRFDSSIRGCGMELADNVKESYTLFAATNVSLLRKLISNPDIPNLTLLLACLDCWRVQFDRRDFTILRSVQIVEVLSYLMKKFKTDGANFDSKKPLTSESRLQDAVAQSARDVFELMTLSCCWAEVPTEDAENLETVDLFESRLLTSLVFHVELLLTSAAKYRTAPVYMEAECYQMLSLLLLVSGCSRRLQQFLVGKNSCAQDHAQSTVLIGALTSIITTGLSVLFLNSLSSRCARRLIRLAYTLVPAVSPRDFFPTVLLSATERDKSIKDASDRFVLDLVRLIGYFSCGRFFDPEYQCSYVKAKTIASEVVYVVRRLQQAPEWEASVMRTLSVCLSECAIDESVFVSEHSGMGQLAQLEAQDGMYRCWGAIDVIGGHVETVRVGARIRTIPGLGDNQPSIQIDTPSFKYGTILGSHRGRSRIVYDTDFNRASSIFAIDEDASTVQAISLLSPIKQSEDYHYNLIYLFRIFRSPAFRKLRLTTVESVSATDPASQLGRQSQVDLCLCLLRVHIMTAICCCLANLVSRQTSNQDCDLLIQEVLNEIAVPDSTKDGSKSVFSALLESISAACPIQGVNDVTEFQQRRDMLMQYLNDCWQTKGAVFKGSVGEEANAADIKIHHPDLYLRACSIYNDDHYKLQKWLDTQNNLMQFNNIHKEVQDFTEEELHLAEMGFPPAICRQAILMCNGDHTSAVNWLVDHGYQDIRSSQTGSTDQKWGLSGVDFFQPKAERNFGRGSTIEMDSSGWEIDPYKEMAIHVSRRLVWGWDNRKRLKEMVSQSPNRKPPDAALKPDLIRAGQTLRISPSWVEEAESKQEQSSRDRFHVYFLTEDNHWAPLSSNDTTHLNKCWQSGSSFTWIGIQDKAPSLVRLDKMCMYNELTGHGRPIKRIKIKEDEKQIEEEDLDDFEEPISSTLDAEGLEMASNLSHLGFSLEWCAQALIHTGFQMDAAANWIFANADMLAEKDEKDARERSKRRQKRELEAKKRKEEEDVRIQFISHSGPLPYESAEKIVAPALMRYKGYFGTVLRVDETKSKVLLCVEDSESGEFVKVWCPATSLEWPDDLLWRFGQPDEMWKRKGFGMFGMAIDSATSEFMVLSRMAMLAVLFLLTSSYNLDELPTAFDVLDSNMLVQIIKIALSHMDSAEAGPMEGCDLDTWSILRFVLEANSNKFENLIPLLTQNIVDHLANASMQVREVTTNHPYTSAMKEKGHCQITGATYLIVMFDRRCNLNQAHANLGFYRDAALVHEIASFSGSGHEFTPFVVPGDQFWYSFLSGPLRKKPYEFGFKFRVIPLAWNYVNEEQVLGQPLGWRLLDLVADSSLIAQQFLSRPSRMDLLEAIQRYLMIARSPHKVFVTRSATQMVVHLRKAGTNGKFSEVKRNFEPLIPLMDKLHNSNIVSGWGCSAYLHALMDLVRILSLDYLDESDEYIWGEVNIYGHSSDWYFVDILRAEQLAQAIWTEQKLPHEKVVLRAYEQLSDLEILRWCIKQPELCLKLQKQVKGWNQTRRDWLKSVNHMTDISEAPDILISLKESMLDEAFVDDDWPTSSAGLKWQQNVRSSVSCAQIARHYLELESQLRWDGFDDSGRAFTSTWSSRRGDWLVSMQGLTAGTQVQLPCPSETTMYPWTRRMDQDLVAFIDEYASKYARRLMSMTFRDIPAVSTLDNTFSKYSSILDVPLKHIRARFAVLKMLSQDFTRCIPLIDLQIPMNCEWSISPVIRRSAKSLLFLQSKMHLWRAAFGRLYSEERPQFVILNRHTAGKIRFDAESRLRHSLFYQLYDHVGRLIDPASLRRRGQAWMVKFVGEGGHDVGGLYNESLVDICNELQGSVLVDNKEVPKLPLLHLCPNGRNKFGENRGKYLPHPSARTPEELQMLEFVGRLMGKNIISCWRNNEMLKQTVIHTSNIGTPKHDFAICDFCILGLGCLDANRALPLDLPSIVWKRLSKETLQQSDLTAVDQHLTNTLNVLSDPDANGINEDSFNHVFPDLFFTTQNSAGEVVEVIPGISDCLVLDLPLVCMERVLHVVFLVLRSSSFFQEGKGFQ